MTELEMLVEELLHRGWDLEMLSPARMSGIERSFMYEARRSKNRGVARRCLLAAARYRSALGENYVPL